VKHRFLAPILGFLGLVLSAAPIVAHHGGASFDTTKELTLKGTVTDWIWANPHCFLKFDAKDDTGTLRNRAVETHDPTDMTRRGWGRSSFKMGDQVTVTLQPFKDASPVGRIRSVLLPNGQTPVAMGAPPAPPTR
jgi:hypothetical protein